MSKSETGNFTEGKILQPLLLFAFPVLLALFLQAMYGAVDLMVVGKFGDAADISGVSTRHCAFRDPRSVCTSGSQNHEGAGGSL